MTLAQYLIPAAVTVLLAFQGALTRTSRLRRDLKADIDLLAALPDALPADHPSRVELTDAIGELTETLARRQRGQFRPIVPGGASFGANVAVTVVALLGVVIMALEATELYEPQPGARQDELYGLIFYAALAVWCAWAAIRARRRAFGVAPARLRRSAS
jgi:hypothetical protein